MSNFWFLCSLPVYPMLFEGGGGYLNLGFILMKYFPKSEIYVAYKVNKISPELKAQLSFSVWLFVRHLKRGTSKGYSSLFIWSRQFKIFISITTRPNSTKLSTKHLWVIVQMKGHYLFQEEIIMTLNQPVCIFITLRKLVLSQLSDVAPESLVYWPLSILKQHCQLVFSFPICIKNKRAIKGR